MPLPTPTHERDTDEVGVLLLERRDGLAADEVPGRQDRGEARGDLVSDLRVLHGQVDEWDGVHGVSLLGGEVDGYALPRAAQGRGARRTFRAGRPEPHPLVGHVREDGRADADQGPRAHAAPLADADPGAHVGPRAHVHSAAQADAGGEGGVVVDPHGCGGERPRWVSAVHDAAAVVGQHHLGHDHHVVADRDVGRHQRTVGQRTDPSPRDRRSSSGRCLTPGCTRCRVAVGRRGERAHEVAPNRVRVRPAPPRPRPPRPGGRPRPRPARGPGGRPPSSRAASGRRRGTRGVTPSRRRSGSPARFGHLAREPTRRDEEQAAPLIVSRRSRTASTTRLCSYSVIWWKSGRISVLSVSRSVTGKGPCG